MDGGGNRATVRADVHDDAVAEMAGRGAAVLVTGSLQTAAGVLGALREGRYRVGSAQVVDKGRRKHILEAPSIGE
jgi:hypothetical protein